MNPERPSIDLRELQARRALGMPDNWRLFSWQCVPSGSMDSTHVRLRGAVCTAVFTRGPRKGRTNWAKRDRSTECEVYISHADHDAFCIQWEAETGHCHECTGTGQTFAGWSVADGVRHRTCTRCLGTGDSPTSPPSIPPTEN